MHQATLLPIIERKVIPDGIVYSDCWRAYNVLDVSEFRHYRINSEGTLTLKFGGGPTIDLYEDLAGILTIAPGKKGAAAKELIGRCGLSPNRLTY